MRFNIQKVFAASALASSALFLTSCSEENPIEIENDERGAAYYDFNKDIEALNNDIDAVHDSLSNAAKASSSSSSATSSSESESNTGISSSSSVAESENYLLQNTLINITLTSFKQAETTDSMPNYRPSLRFKATYSSDGVFAYSDKSAYLLNTSTKYTWKKGFVWADTINGSIPVSKGVDKIVLCAELQNLSLDDEEDGEVVDDLCIKIEDVGKIELRKSESVKLSDDSYTIKFNWELVPND